MSREGDFYWGAAPMKARKSETVPQGQRTANRQYFHGKRWRWQSGQDSKGKGTGRRVKEREPKSRGRDHLLLRSGNHIPLWPESAIYIYIIYIYYIYTYIFNKGPECCHLRFCRPHTGYAAQSSSSSFSLFYPFFLIM